MNRAEILNRIEAERARQIDLPGSEMDVRNTPNEWAAIAAHYLTEEVRRGGHTPDRKAFEKSFVKAAAVILAALENADAMVSLGHLSGEGDTSLGDALAKIMTPVVPTKRRLDAGYNINFETFPVLDLPEGIGSASTAKEWADQRGYEIKIASDHEPYVVDRANHVRYHIPSFG